MLIIIIRQMSHRSSFKEHKISQASRERERERAKGLVYMQAPAIGPEVTTVSSTVSKEVERANKSD